MKNNKFEIPDPVYLLSLYHEDFRKGNAGLYDWQVEVLLRYADEKQIPNRMAVCAANGSGKSQFIVAPCALWTAMRYERAQVVITSASGDQIDNQVCRALNNLAISINKVHGKEIIKVNYRKYECVPSGSVIDLYATDDPGKAEGYHPIKIGGMFSIIVDEAKSVSDDIFKAIARCTGWTHRLDVSSPGLPRGYFYRIFSSGEFNNIWKRRVRYDECRHISDREAKETREIMGDQFYRSAFLAEFVSDEDNVVMTLNDIYKSVNNTSEKLEHPVIGNTVFGGLDLSSGNDETVFVIFEGCKMKAMECWRERDAVENVNIISSIIEQYHIDPSNIYADDGGLGRPMIDMLGERGYHVNRVLNQSPAFENKLYGNRGAEMWFNLSHWIKNGQISIFNDDKLITQLGSRRYTRHRQTGKIILESKQDARRRGGVSPDRADALALAFCNFNYYNKEETLGKERDSKEIIDVINEINMQRKLNASGGVSSSEYYDCILDVVNKYVRNE